MDQSHFCVLRAGGCHVSHPRETLSSFPKEDTFIPAAEQEQSLALAAYQEPWHYLGEGGLAPDTAWWGAGQQLSGAGQSHAGAQGCVCFIITDTTQELCPRH